MGQHIVDVEHAEAMLVAAAGPRLQSMLPAGLVTHRRSRVDTDEVHLILEYSKNEKWGAINAGRANRFSNPTLTLTLTPTF